MTVSQNETMEKNTEAAATDKGDTEAGKKGRSIKVKVRTAETDEQAAAEEASMDDQTVEPENDDIGTSDEIDALKQELETVKKEKADINDRFMRAAAEFDNYKKRLDRQWTDFKKYANESLIKELLTVVDNLERALCAVDGNDSQTRGLCDGISMTVDEIFKIFEKFGVTRLDSVGKPFNPNYHQAVARQASDTVAENIVLEEFQKGYMIHDRLLRPAMVVVSAGKEESKE
ncbi:MAG: nucleotide exchange factor GrpE [Thermodesulfobacteriota bacterium]|nr:nucleotide exchange factor GrpE [Thermodesulfobacteriota bacterium]